MTSHEPRSGLARILVLDAATCAAMGLLLLVASSPLAGLTGIPAPLLLYAGLALIPIALYMAAVARVATGNALAVWLVVLGNIGWALASLGLFAVISPNILGTAFILAQAAVVAALAWAELAAWRAGGARQATIA
jgi:hypothetical protein